MCEGKSENTPERLLYLDIGEIVLEDNSEVTIATLDQHRGDLGPLLAAAPEMHQALPDLSSVITWLENGCDPLKARDELLIYKARIDEAKAKAESWS
ncbi:hypothetical protein [Stappia sp. WLB 29]|uniref:hypothetical protein n=1 Tax=Stappia sp. WLB 29 TaxID=2925220 RepID=UPI0020BF931F|nr:hypothetical protein [Stappia sp. WLB 29]